MAKKTTKKTTGKTKYGNPNRKTRSYLQIIYEESAPQNFVNLLQAEVDKGKLRYFILSPWHDRDWYTDEDVKKYAARLQLGALEPDEIQNPPVAGTYKKKHCHLIAELTYNSQQYYANTYFHNLTNGSFVKPREDLRGAVRYLAHLDEDPRKKALYDPDLICAYGDIKVDKFLVEEDKSMTSTMCWVEIKELIDDNEIRSIVDFEDLLLKQDIQTQMMLQTNMNLRLRVDRYIRELRYDEMYNSKETSLNSVEKAMKMVQHGATIETAIHESGLNRKFGKNKKF